VQTAAVTRERVTRRAFFLEKHATAVGAVSTVLAIAALVVWELVTAGGQIADWDYLFVSGCLTTLGGLWLARGQPERFAEMFERLVNRQALEAEPALVPDLGGLRDEFGARAERWSGRGGIGLGLVIAVAWITVNATRDKDLRLFDEIAGPIVGTVGGYLVGRVLGRMLSYGTLGPFLARRRVSFGATPGHVDGAAGPKPIGDYYLYQALLLALPAVFLFFWSLMFLLPSWASRYDGWRQMYLALLALAIALEIAAFVAPMWHAHIAMKHAKRKALVSADTTLAHDIAAARARLEEDLSKDDRAAARDRLDRLTARYEAIETMPTWPDRPRMLRRRITLGNAGLILGLVTQVAALAGWS
jgi:hypothetical protein